MARVGIFGGSFNPVHHGHLRLAVEAREGLGLHRVEFVPTARHPIKGQAGFLPSALRWRLLLLALCGRPGLGVNLVEEALPGPSYTVRTLERLHRQRPATEHVFLVGSEDLLAMESWREAARLPEFAHLAVVPRDEADLAAAAAFIAQFWPGSRRTSEMRWEFAGGTSLTWLPMPVLPISATAVRGRFITGKSLLGLVPEPVEAELIRRRSEVVAAWGKPGRS